MAREQEPSAMPVREPDAATRPKTTIGTTCPDCSAGTCAKCGSRVPGLTITSLLTEAAKARLASPEGFRFCGSPTCATVYWNPETGERFTKQDLRVRVGLKETTPPRPVCYCFGFAVEDIEAQVRKSGTSTIADEITAKVRQRLCHCEDANPQGTCCLGNVRAALRVAQEAQGTEGRLSPNATDRAPRAEPVHACCAEPGGSVCTLPAAVAAKAAKASAPSNVATHACCAREAAPTSPIPPEGAASRAGLVSSIGAVVSAILASACCWLPLLLIAFGASAASVAGFFEQYRLAFLGGAGVLLALGFYFVYFRREACGPGGVCAVPRPGLRRFNQVVLWIATALVLVAGAFPSYVGVFLRGRDRTETPAAPRLGPRALYSIDGMTCEACTVTIRSELERLPGVARVEVSFERKDATIWAAEGALLPADSLVVDAVRRAGYVAVRR